MMRPGEFDPRDAAQARQLPQSIEAEQAVLGGLLLVPGAYVRIADSVSAADFLRRDHQLIFEAVKHYGEKGRSFDYLIIGRRLKDQGSGDDVSDDYLIQLASTTPSAANIVAYAGIVRDKAVRRRLIEMGTAIADDAFSSSDDAADLLGAALTKVSSLMVDEPCDLQHIAPVMSRVLDDLTERHERGGQIQGLGTGINDLDAAINGLNPGLYILAARPKMGKSTLAQNIAEHVGIKLRRPVAIFPLEMQDKTWGERMVSSVGDVPAEHIRRGTLEQYEWERVNSAISEINQASIFIAPARSTRIGSICAQIRRLKAQRADLALVVIDYLQLIDTGPVQNKAQELGEVTRKLALLAQELGLSILLLSQLNRKLEDRPNKRPVPSDLRDSGAIEQDADVVIFVYRDEAYHPESRFRGTAEIIIALQRNGAPGELRVRHKGDRFRFENLPSGWEPEPLPAAPEGGKPARRGMGGNKRKGGNPAADAAAGGA